MKICLLEPFFTGSHQAWAVGYQNCSKHKIEILSLPGFHWKWRMHGGAVSLAKQFLALTESPDLILATDMLDLAVFLSLTRKKSQGIPVALYFHENQLTYPWSPTDPDKKLQRDNHYAFINYTSALSADYLFFNSNYHLRSFTSALPTFLHQFPDYQEKENVLLINQKSAVLPLGMDLKKFDGIQSKRQGEKINLLWNHRWEYDKNPAQFYTVLKQLAQEGFDFSLSIVGQSYKESPKEFQALATDFEHNINVFGYQSTFEDYAKVLRKASILPVTSNQDFFGGSVVEAIYCGVYPLLPDRLAYNEHLPETEKVKHLYQNEEELLSKLRGLLSGEMDPTKKERLIDFVSTYDWTNLGPIYDETFEKIII